MSEPTVRPTREESCMAMARVAAMRSTCSRAQVGVAFACDGRVLVTGYNGAPAGMPHCSHACDCGYTPDEGLYFAGKHLSDCSTLTACSVSVHAEANAIAWAARHGVKLEGSELYCTYTPCLPCAQLIVNVGVVKVFCEKPYRLKQGAELLVQAGIDVVDWATLAR